MDDKRVGADAENVASIGNVKAHVACIVVASYKSHGNAQPRYNISKFHCESCLFFSGGINFLVECGVGIHKIVAGEVEQRNFFIGSMR